MVEEWMQPTKHPNKILVSMFFTMKATILDTHYSIAYEKNVFAI